MSSVDQEYHWKTLGPASVLPSFSPAPDVPAVDEPAGTSGLNEQQSGYEAGYAAGESAGRAAFDAAHQASLQALQAAVAELTHVRSEVFARSFADMADALKALFSTLFLHEMRTDPALVETLCGIMQEALESATAPELRLSRDDYAHVAPMADQLEVTISEDAHLPTGVMRAVVGKSVAELDVAGNLNDVLTQAVQTLQIDEAEMASLPRAEKPQPMPDASLPDDPERS